MPRFFLIFRLTEEEEILETKLFKFTRLFLLVLIISIVFCECGFIEIPLFHVIRDWFIVQHKYANEHIIKLHAELASLIGW